MCSHAYVSDQHLSYGKSTTKMLKEAFKTCFAFTKPTTVRYIIRLDMERICMRKHNTFLHVKIGRIFIPFFHVCFICTRGVPPFSQC